MCCREPLSPSRPGPLPPPEPRSSRPGPPEVTRLSKSSPEVFARCHPIQKVVPPPRYAWRGDFRTCRSRRRPRDRFQRKSAPPAAPPATVQGQEEQGTGEGGATATSAAEECATKSKAFTSGSARPRRPLSVPDVRSAARGHALSWPRLSAGPAPALRSGRWRRKAPEWGREPQISLSPTAGPAQAP